MPRVLPAVFAHPRFSDYQLLDSGAGERFERFGGVTLVRPDPQALWRPRLERARWEEAHLTFERESDRGGRWRVGTRAPEHLRGRSAEWTIAWQGALLCVRPTPFKHLGIFPEQAANWTWMLAMRARLGAQPGKLLNVFGYTGAASVIAARAGFEVTHVDASRTSLAWARDNARASDVPEERLRCVLEDARLFAERERRRGHRYAGILIDPPHYGSGPKGEKWQFEEHIGELLESTVALLDERAFLCLSAYAIGLLPLTLFGMLQGLVPGSEVEAGELALPEEPTPGGAAGRLLSCGMCARLTRALS